jgi:hypothetical protein
MANGRHEYRAAMNSYRNINEMKWRRMKMNVKRDGVSMA